ncbi:MAG TPA: hypothetical protein VFM55_03505 [Micromonosporaceae bacterium]|nr:hypothetical protein [Micromonosporaceae bacterium]
MDDSLLDKAQRLQAIAGEVRAALGALHDARRLASRASDLRTAVTAPALAAQTWHACAEAGVPDLTAPQDAGLASAVTNLRQRLDAGEPPPDSDFDTIRHGLAALARRTDEAIAQAWPRFARSKAEAAGLASVRVLPPATRQSLTATITAVEQAMTPPPANPSQVQAFAHNLAQLERQMGDARVRELPAPLVQVFDRLGTGGFPLRELTAQQLRLLHEHGFADDLVLRWTA